jgi:hypothetical protein
LLQIFLFLPLFQGQWLDSFYCFGLPPSLFGPIHLTAPVRYGASWIFGGWDTHPALLRQLSPAMFKTQPYTLLITHPTPYVFFSLLHCVLHKQLAKLSFSAVGLRRAHQE